MCAYLKTFMAQPFSLTRPPRTGGQVKSRRPGRIMLRWAAASLNNPNGRPRRSPPLHPPQAVKSSQGSWGASWCGGRPPT